MPGDNLAEERDMAARTTKTKLEPELVEPESSTDSADIVTVFGYFDGWHWVRRHANGHVALRSGGAFAWIEDATADALAQNDDMTESDIVTVNSGDALGRAIGDDA